MSEIINASCSIVRGPSRKSACPFRTHEVSFEYIVEVSRPTRNVKYAEIMVVWRGSNSSHHR